MRIRVPGEKLSDGLAWSAFVLAIIGGFAATHTFIGEIVVHLVQIGPWYMALALGVVGFLFILGDLLEDGIPDRLRTVYITILWPSTWLAMEGKVGKFLNGWIDKLNAYLDANLGAYISDKPRAQGAIMTGVAVVAISFALVWAHRYATKKKANSTAAAGTASGTPAVRGRARGR